MEKFRERVGILLKDKRITLAKVSQGIRGMQVKLSRQINGESAITLDVVMLFLDYFPELRAEWLLRGEGEMYKGNTNFVQDEHLPEPEKLVKAPMIELFSGTGNLSTNSAKLAEVIQSAISSNNEYIKILARMQEQQDTIKEMGEILKKGQEQLLSQELKESLEKLVRNP